MRLIVNTLTVISLFIAGTSDAQSTRFSRGCLDSIEGWMNKAQVPGLGIGIIESGKISMIKTYGKRVGGQQLNKGALYNVASLTKPVVAITVLKLVQAGLWNLDEPISNHFIDPDIAGNPWTSKLTTRIILSHQTGFPNWRDQLASKKLAFKFEPGTQFGYSGEGFEYLRKALENKFNRSLQDISDSILFKPLHLTKMRYSWKAGADTNQYAFPHDKQGNLLVRPIQTKTIAADWLVTTVKDYCLFSTHVMRGAGLSQQLFNDMASSHVKIGNSPIETMGLGWEVLKGLPGDEYVLTHTGHDDGVTTLVLLLPKSKRGLVIFTNGDDGFTVIAAIARAMIGMKELDPYLGDL